MTEQNEWARMTLEDPEHSTRYVQRFRDMAAAGHDLAGEARLIDALVPPGSRILDAGCGTGRVGAVLARAGHTVVGVDLDPVLIAAAEQDHPGSRWILGDLAALDLPSQGIAEGFDAVVCAGNVMAFLAPRTRREVLGRFRSHLRPDGRVVIGFGAGRGYEVDEFLGEIDDTALVPDLLLSTWHLHPYRAGDDFLVAVLRPR